VNGRKSRVRRLTLTNFKGFRHAVAPLGDFTVVVGANASGKSNLRDALRFLHGVARGYSLAEAVGEKWVEGGVLVWRGIRGGLREVSYDHAPTFGLEVDILLDAKEGPRTATWHIDVAVDPASDRPSVAAERLAIEGEVVFEARVDSKAATLVATNGRGLVLNDEPLTAHRPVLIELAESSGWPDVQRSCRATREALASVRFIDLDPEAMKQPSLPGQLVLGDRGENLSSVLQEICRYPELRSALVRWIRELTPLDVVDLEFTSDQIGRVLVTLVESSGRRTSAYSASDGTLRFLAWLAAFLGPDPARLYVFEEIETGLHPNRLHLLLQLIERSARHGPSQVVATTHSSGLLAFLEPATREETLVTFRREDEPAQRITRLMDIPHAREVLAHQDLSLLHEGGWLEDAIAFSMPPENAP
jgi:predicted ATPase